MTIRDWSLIGLVVSLVLNLVPFYLRWRDRRRMERLLDGMR